MSGGAAEMLSNKYACRVFAGMEVMSERRALGVADTAGIEESECPGRLVIAILGCGPVERGLREDGDYMK